VGDKLFLFLALAGILLVVAGCMIVTNPATKRKDIILIDDAQEVEIGRQVAAKVEKRYQVSRDPKLNSWVKEIGQRLAAVSERKNLEFEFKVLERKEINAFALPGGFIYVNKGLLAMVDDDSELAGVLGHEIGHITARHGIKKLQNQIGYSLLISILFKNNDTTRRIIDTAFTLISLGYSREDEFEADKLSVIYTYKAGYNPEGMVKFLQKLKQMEKREPLEIETFLSTHPPTSERIKRIKEEIARMIGKK